MRNRLVLELLEHLLRVSAPGLIDGAPEWLRLVLLTLPVVIDLGITFLLIDKSIAVIIVSIRECRGIILHALLHKLLLVSLLLVLVLLLLLLLVVVLWLKGG